MKKYSLSLQESNVKFNLGNTLYEVKTIQKIQYIQLTQLNENLLSIKWYSLGREYNTKQWNMVLYNPTTGVKGEKIILPDSDFISVTQNKLGVIAIAQSNNNKIILSRLYEGQLITRSIPAVSYSQQRVKINSLSTNEFIVIKWTTQYNFEIRRFNKYFEASQNPFRIQTKEFCSVEKIQQIDISFTESKLIFVSKCDEEIKLQQIDLLNIENNQYISEQYRQIKTQNKQNIQSIQINYIDHNRLLLRWFTQKHYFNELKVQLIDMNLKINECILNCDICDIIKLLNKRQFNCNRFKCQQCQQNYQLDTIKNECKPICPINCLYCSDSTYCDKCKLGYQYTKENLCVNPDNDFMELKVSREVETKGKGKLINKDFYIIVIYSIYQNDKQQYLVIRKLDNQGQLLKKVELQKDQQTLLDYDIADSLVDEIFYILIKWVSVDGSTTIINYSYNLEDLTIKEEYLITDKSTIIVGDQIKIINYKQQKIYFFYFTKENDYYTLKQIIMNQNDVYTNSNYYHLSYKDNFELKSYRNSIGNEYMTILNDDYYQQCQIMDTSLNCYQDTNQDRTEFFSQKIIKIDQISLYLDQDIYLNRQLYLNNTDNYKIQITQSSRYQQNHIVILIFNYIHYILIIYIYTIHSFKQEKMILLFYGLVFQISNKTIQYQIFIFKVFLKKLIKLLIQSHLLVLLHVFNVQKLEYVYNARIIIIYYTKENVNYNVFKIVNLVKQKMNVQNVNQIISWILNLNVFKQKKITFYKNKIICILLYFKMMMEQYLLYQLKIMVLNMILFMKNLIDKDNLFQEKIEFQMIVIQQYYSNNLNQLNKINLLLLVIQ